MGKQKQQCLWEAEALGSHLLLPGSRGRKEMPPMGLVWDLVQFLCTPEAPLSEQGAVLNCH